MTYSSSIFLFIHFSIDLLTTLVASTNTFFRIRMVPTHSNHSSDTRQLLMALVINYSCISKQLGSMTHMDLLESN